MKALLGLLLCMSTPVTCLAQNPRSVPDPILQAEAKAQREGRLADAEKIIRDAIRAAEQTENPQLATYLRSLGVLYDVKGWYSDALAAYQRALALDQKNLGVAADDTLLDLGSIAGNLRSQGEADRAEELLKQAIELTRQHPESSWQRVDRVAMLVDYLVSLYQSQHRVSEADPLLEEAMRSCESLKPMPPDCAGLRGVFAQIDRQEGKPVETIPADPNTPVNPMSFDKAARQYAADGLYVQAEATYRQAINWIEEHPVTWIRNPGQTPIRQNWSGRLSQEYEWIGRVLEKQGRNNEAEASYKKSIELQQANIDPKQAVSLPVFVPIPALNELTNLYRNEGRLSDIEPIFEHALEVEEALPGEHSAELAKAMSILANIYAEEGKKEQSKYSKAVPLYERVLSIQAKNFGPDHPNLLGVLTSYVNVARSLGDQAKAAELQAWIDRIERGSEAQTQRGITQH